MGAGVLPRPWGQGYYQGHGAGVLPRPSGQGYSLLCPGQSGRDTTMALGAGVVLRLLFVCSKLAAVKIETIHNAGGLDCFCECAVFSCLVTTPTVWPGCKLCAVCSCRGTTPAGGSGCILCVVFSCLVTTPAGVCIVCCLFLPGYYPCWGVYCVLFV